MDRKKTQYSLFSLTAILSVAAFTLTLIGILQCRFIKFTDVSGVTLEFGVWKYLHHWIDACQTYPASTDRDASWISAKVFSFLALAFGAGLSVFDSLFVCAVCAGEYGVAGETGSYPNTQIKRGMVIIAHLLTGIFTGLILLILNSNICRDNRLVKDETSLNFQDDVVCEFSTGAELVISAGILWFLATLCTTQLDINSGRDTVSLAADYAHPLIGGKDEVI